MNTQPDQIDIFMDVCSPDCYLAFEGVKALLDTTGLSPRWAAASRPPRVSTEARENDSVSARHKRVRQDYRDNETARYARWRGLKLSTPKAQVDRELFANALEAADQADLGALFLERCFQHYWMGEERAMDGAFFRELLRDLGVEGELVSSSLESPLEALGIFDVPAFRIEGEVFIGRQHLPLITRIAREGAAAVIPPLPPKKV